jgi:hypothetical protein
MTNIKDVETKLPVKFINAHEGGIMMYCAPGEVIAYSKTAEGIAAALVNYGHYDAVHAGSSMDFAAENGFKNDDDANKLWDEALGIYNWEVNGVAS